MRARRDRKEGRKALRETLEERKMSNSNRFDKKVESAAFSFWFFFAPSLPFFFFAQEKKSKSNLNHKAGFTHSGAILDR